MAQTWDHGYHSSTAYTSGFYRELVPSWLDYAALIQSHQPPRQQEGDAFTYLDLGCGTGFGLVLMAALHPEGRFFGVDFHPDHVAHGCDLVDRMGLNNLQIIEADFLALAERPELCPWPDAACDYVVAHGVATWVSSHVQSALLTLVSRALRHGGLFYCSYNTYPGWLARSSLQKLVSLEAATGKAEDEGLFELASGVMKRLLGGQAESTPLSTAYPVLEQELDGLKHAPPSYLAGEFTTAAWAPLYVCDMHQRFAKYKLTPLGSATLSDSFPDLLPENIRQVVAAEPRAAMRELLVDLGTNKSFRRDLVVKGRLRLTRREQLQRLSVLEFSLLLPRSEWLSRPLDTLQFRTSSGMALGDPQAYTPLLDALAEVTLGFDALLALSRRSVPELLMMLALLLEDGAIGLDRGRQGRSAASGVQALNQLILARICDGGSYSQIGIPAVANAAPISVVEALACQALAEGLEEPMLSGCVLLGLRELNIQLLGSDRQLIDDPQQQLNMVISDVAEFVSSKRSWFQRFGGLEEPSPPSRSRRQRRS
jgi:SAM-dependent methyltransferase